MISIISLLEENDPVSTISSLTTSAMKSSSPDGNKAANVEAYKGEKDDVKTTQDQNKIQGASIMSQLKKSAMKSKSPASPKLNNSPDKSVAG